MIVFNEFYMKSRGFISFVCIVLYCIQFLEYVVICFGNKLLLQVVKDVKIVGGFLLKVEVECRSVDEVLEAVEVGSDIIMLDNFFFEVRLIFIRNLFSFVFFIKEKLD